MINETKLKESIAKITKENPEKRLAQGKKYLSDALVHKEERRQACNKDVKEMVKDAVVHMKRAHSGGLIMHFGGFGKRKPLVCEVCNQKVSSIVCDGKRSMCKPCKSKQQGNKATVLVMPKYLKFRRAS
jgi:hypothetical protein